MAEPYWKPSVHSVQPRAVYLPLTVKTGAPVGEPACSQRANLWRRHLEQAIDGGNEIGGCARAIEANHEG